MLALEAFSRAARAAVQVVLTDIDDTLTSGRRLPAVAYTALERLRVAGKIVIPVTGRPAGWCDLIARLWPVDAVVGENGAFYFRCDGEGRMHRAYFADPAARTERQRRLDRLRHDILAAVPRARVAADQAYREFDLAIDFAEEIPPLSDVEIDRIVQCFTEAGAVAKVSSIHVNGWFGEYDKLTMTRRLLDEVFGIDIDRDNGRIVFIGDSPNDAPMFGFFENSVAVANFRAFADRVADKPRWMTKGAGGEGFSELADALLDAAG